MVFDLSSALKTLEGDYPTVLNSCRWTSAPTSTSFSVGTTTSQTASCQSLNTSERRNCKEENCSPPKEYPAEIDPYDFIPQRPRLRLATRAVLPKIVEEKAEFRTYDRSKQRKASRYCQETLNSGVNIDSILLQPVSLAPTLNATPVVVATVSSPLALVLNQDHGRQTSAPSFLGEESTETPSFTAVFCIRRAGCGSCRNNGRQLGQLKEEYGSKMNLFGIVKETGVDDEALLEFYSDYFPFPLHQDTKQDAFRFFGNRKISVWKLFRTAKRVGKMYDKRKIVNRPLGGDIFTQGGVLLFDKSGKLRFVFYESYGDDLDLDAMRFAIQDILQQQGSASEASSSMDSSYPEIRSLSEFSERRKPNHVAQVASTQNPPKRPTRGSSPPPMSERPPQMTDKSHRMPSKPSDRPPQMLACKRESPPRMPTRRTMSPPRRPVREVSPVRQGCPPRRPVRETSPPPPVLELSAEVSPTLKPGREESPPRKPVREKSLPRKPAREKSLPRQPAREMSQPEESSQPQESVRAQYPSREPGEAVANLSADPYNSHLNSYRETPVRVLDEKNIAHGPPVESAAKEKTSFPEKLVKSEVDEQPCPHEKPAKSAAYVFFKERARAFRQFFQFLTFGNGMNIAPPPKKWRSSLTRRAAGSTRSQSLAKKERNWSSKLRPSTKTDNAQCESRTEMVLRHVPEAQIRQASAA